MLCLLLWLGGCASLPAGVQREPSRAIAASDATLLGRIASQSQPDDALTGVRLLPTGPFALDTRLALVRHAQASLDVQYYVLQNDDTGRVLLRALRDAAERGVRVRLLLDDLYTAETDGLLLGLAGHANVQVRLFNPFPAGRQGVLSRFIGSAGDFSRVNRRMHNKLFIVDGAMAVLGGRNIADEYFMRHAQANFVDLDAFVVGALLPDLQEAFDDYWNSHNAYPLHAIVPPDAPAEVLRQRFATAVADAPEPPPPPATDVLGYGPVSDEIDSGRLGLVWAFATAYADPPDRIKGQGASYGNVPLEDVQSVRYSVVDMIRGARREVVITSPYLIPGEQGMAMFAAQRARGVGFKLLTNSLAATDEPLVHLGYRKYRPGLLKLGVDLYELSPLRVKRSSRLGFLMPSLGRLHAKTVVVDRQRVFIGSMNFDPRSDKHNTELGMFIDSPELAREMLRLMDLDKLQAAYRVSLATDGQGLRWLAADDEGEISLDSEPDVGWLLRLWLELLAPLAPEELL
ncbi:phospholipase D-like domain-containing protein [Aquabacterium sp. OR-4]|uniref:phospholipase D-like domain-containing protein n=1 Tax=Aquabacterium sp. OR-4 TaxID=2978127 RepID=UPI0021B2E5E0|nr:phospholipase D family protein [Aquabacterium sp. OR-4]MDT7834888.1 phospholipase D family protein [Aquabacterium sp. OR-4]